MSKPINQEIELRLLCYEKAQGNIQLAKDYESFLCNAKDSGDFELRLRCISEMEGKELEDIGQLYHYLIDGSLNL